MGQDKLGNNACHYAACCGRVELLSYMVQEHCCDLHATNGLGRDVCWWALEKEQSHVTRWLHRHAPELFMREEGDFRHDSDASAGTVENSDCDSDADLLSEHSDSGDESTDSDDC